MNVNFEKNNDVGLLILRVFVAGLMLFHGIAKVFHGVSFIEGQLTSVGLPAFIAYGVYIGEVIAPIAMIVGFRTRLASVIFAFTCVVAILLVHSVDIFSLNKHGGWAIELLALYLFGSVALFFTGAGKYAISKVNQWD